MCIERHERTAPQQMHETRDVMDWDDLSVGAPSIICVKSWTVRYGRYHAVGRSQW